MKIISAAIVLLVSTLAQAQAITWHSATTGTDLSAQLQKPDKPVTTKDGTPLVVYLKNTSVPRLGTEADEPIIHDLLGEGDLVLVVDYAHDANAVSPKINADVLKLRTDLGGKKPTLLADQKSDQGHIFILLEGFRLKRNVEFATDGNRVLAMDVFYPSQPKQPVPSLIEFTCDNANRMGNFSILFCQDSLVEGGQAAGFATVMADHPVAPPYKGMDDPMPQVIYRCKAAVRTLRSLSADLHLSGKIGAIGFSRGGPMAAFLSLTNGQADLEGDGEHKDVSSDVQAALVHGNRYDYTNIGPDDPMYKRFEQKWGKQDDNKDKWNAHGPMNFLKGKPVPMFLNTSDKESKEYQAGLATLDKKLTELGVEHVYQVDPDGRGHKVSSDPKTLAEIYAFFAKYLQ